MMTTNKMLAEQAATRISESATARQIEAGKRLTAALEGDIKSRHWISEGISTSDIPTLLTPAINVRFLQKYAAVPTVWGELATEILADSLDGAKWGSFDVDASALAGNHGGEVYVNGALPVVGEYDEYPAVKYKVSELAADLHKSGVRARLSWESILKTGNVRLIEEFINYFGTAAARTEDVKLAREFANAGGTLNTTNWTAPRQITGNPALTLTGLDAALAKAKTATDSAGNPVRASRYKLVVTPALEQTARNLLSISTITRTDGNGTYEVSASTITGNIDLVVFDAIAAAELGAAALNAHWWLIPVGVNPAFGEIFLDGYRTPLISIKDSGHFTVGGNGVPVRDGSFEVDDVQTRVRHVVDAATIDLSGAVWSNGTGS